MVNETEQEDPDDGIREPAEILTEAEARVRDEAEAQRPRFDIEIVGENVSKAMDDLRTKVKYWADRGRYNKIRVKRGGKPVLPDIPVGALMALEAATFFWSGLLRGLVVNVVGRALFEVELINEAEEHFSRGLEHFLAGDMKDADGALTRALEIDSRYARAHLQLGVLRKIEGKLEEASAHFENAIAYSTNQETRREAEVHLKRLRETK
jgi:tetratricopeptide (TPR) repeat protein